ncbi:MepB family protein [uncultured Flavobacterium sp.]|uniref:MepB family protein n=1 Tax=uncultured Flavobacterium sp. TaxID=165435 RepID=UPI0030ECFAB5|tara:strand:+ start:16476 stop:16973 length:498 start_codon:yes stop_codon:yes gene_type:complete
MTKIIALKYINSNIYKKLNFKISKLIIDKESQEYDGCEFVVDEKRIIFRSAKITPKKVGQFVPFWKRNKEGITEPFSENDTIDLYVINVQSENKVGQFVFPKSVLIEKGIISTSKKDGKRGFRVYPIWDKTINKQAIVTQKWQLNYFFEVKEDLDFNFVKKLYSN